jgi:hypothetical protein
MDGSLCGEGARYIDSAMFTYPVSHSAPHVVHRYVPRNHPSSTSVYGHAPSTRSAQPLSG